MLHVCQHGSLKQTNSNFQLLEVVAFLTMIFRIESKLVEILSAMKVTFVWSSIYTMYSFQLIVSGAEHQTINVKHLT